MSHKDVAAVHAVVSERVAAIEAGNVSRANATLALDLVAFEMVPPLALTGAEARDDAATEAWLRSWDGPVSIELRDLAVVADGEVAFAHSLQRLSGVRGGRSVSIWLRSTLGLRKVAGEWKIAHAHTSVPFHADGSFRAALDLTPK